MPDDIPMVSPAQVAEWISAGTCVPVDAREDHEHTDGPPVLNAVALKYSQVADADLLKDVASVQVAQLQELQGQGKYVVFFSCSGSTFDKCYFVASTLLDLFGLNPDLIYRMQGGYDAWKSWLDDASDADMEDATAQGDADSPDTAKGDTADSDSVPADTAATSSSS